MTMTWIGLRAHRTGFLVTAVLGFLAIFLQATAFGAAAGTTAASRAAFGHSIEVLALQLAYLLPLPVRPDTLAGYVQWRAYGSLTIIVAVWALLAATGAIRNEEERGLLETWLAAGVGRIRLVAARFTAFAVAATGALALATLGALLGGAAAHDQLGVVGLIEIGLALLGLTLTCFAVGLVAAQLVASRRGASALGGVILLALFFLDSFSRLNSQVGSWALVSPFHLRNQTTALAPGGSFDLAGTFVLFAMAVLLAAVSALAFERRDLGASVLGWRQADREAVLTPSANPLLRVPVLSALYEQRLGLLAWLLVAVALAGLLASLAASAGDLMRGTPAFQAYFRFAHTTDPTLLTLGVFWFGVAGFLFAAYTITQVGRWASDDGEGRLEMTIAQPVPRWRVVLERGLTLGVAVSLLAGFSSAAIALVAPGQGIHLDAGRLLLATVLLVPLALTFGALGAAVIARLPRLALPALAAVAVVGFFIEELAPLFKWPDWALNLSLFQLYGTPLTSGLFRNGLFAMLAIVVIGFGVALVGMRYREVGS
jgi:ABC-2 type transport system permease protein